MHFPYVSRASDVRIAYMTYWHSRRWVSQGLAELYFHFLMSITNTIKTRKWRTELLKIMHSVKSPHSYSNVTLTRKIQTTGYWYHMCSFVLFSFFFFFLWCAVSPWVQIPLSCPLFEKQVSAYNQCSTCSWGSADCVKKLLKISCYFLRRGQYCAYRRK